MRDPYADLDEVYANETSRNERRKPRPSTGRVPRTPSLDDMDWWGVIPGVAVRTHGNDVPLFGFHIEGDRSYE